MVRPASLVLVLLCAPGALALMVPRRSAGTKALASAPSTSPSASGSGSGIVPLSSSSGEGDGHAHGDGGEPCGCAQYEADHPFKIDCSDKATINAAIDRLKKLTPSKAECEKVVDGVMTNQVDFFIMQAHHDYCDHDTLRTGDEKIFHDWESVLPQLRDQA